MTNTTPYADHFDQAPVWMSNEEAHEWADEQDRKAEAKVAGPKHLAGCLATFDLATAMPRVAPEGLTDNAWFALYAAVATSRAMGAVGTYTEDRDGVCYYAGRSTGSTYYVRLATPERDGESGTSLNVSYPSVQKG